MLVVAKESAKFPGALLLVFSFDDRSFVDTYTNGDAPAFVGLFACVDNRIDLTSIGDVARVEADFVNARFDRFKSPFEMKMDIGDDGNRCLIEDFPECLGVFTLGNSHANDVRTSLGQSIDLCDTGIDIVGWTRSHGLDTDRCDGGRWVGFRRKSASDLDDAGAIVADENGSGWFAWNHGVIW